MIVSMLAHFAVGAMRTVFTGRRTFRSGFDMFVVGLGVVAVRSAWAIRRCQVFEA